MFRFLLGFLFVYLLARVVVGLFRGAARLGRAEPERRPAEEPDPLKNAEIEDADWEEIDDGKGDSA